MVFFYWAFLITLWSIPTVLFVSKAYARLSTYYFFGIIFLSSIFLFTVYNKSIFWYQLAFSISCFKSVNIQNIIGIDGFSVALILLCVFLLTYCCFVYRHLRYKANLYFFLLLVILWLLLNLFSTLDLILFYIYFEGIAIPMFLIIGIWGSRSRKIYAAYQFFLYTLLGSTMVLVAIACTLYGKGSTSFDIFLNSYFFTNRQLILWSLMFLGFSVKIPIIPLHIWLPEAHVEAPTPGSVILAGILLKLGSYAIIRLLLFSINDLPYDYIFILLNIALIGCIHSSFAAYGQVDAKKIIAYSSVAHMNFSLLGLFSNTLYGLVGFYYLMFGHAITSGALFLAIGVFYDRYKTRLIFYYGSLVVFMPLFSLLFFILTLSNIGFPGTVNFVGEFFILSGMCDYAIVLIILSTVAVVYTLIFSLSLYNRLFFGPVPKMFIRFYSDCTRLEFYLLVTLCAVVLILGLYPSSFLQYSIPVLVKASIIYY